MDKTAAYLGHKILHFGRCWLPHILFCCLLICIFPKTSGMRPVLHWIPYKERLAAIIVLALLYSHYLFFIPRLLIQARCIAYAICAVATISTGAALELLIIEPELMRTIYKGFPPNTHNTLLFGDLRHVFYRDAALLAFFILLSLYQHTAHSIHKLQKSTANHLQVVCVKDADNNSLFLNISDILYCQQERNYTHIITTQQEYRLRSSLRQTCETLGENCVQVNRYQAAMLPHILERKKDYILVGDMNRPETATKLVVTQGFQSAGL